MDFLEKYNAENLQDFAQSQSDFEFLLDNRNQNVNADGSPDLSLHCIFGIAKKRFDSQILLDPFEEDFYLQAAFVKLCNRQSRLGIEVTDQAESSRINGKVLTALFEDRFLCFEGSGDRLFVQTPYRGIDRNRKKLLFGGCRDIDFFSQPIYIYLVYNILFI